MYKQKILPSSQLTGRETSRWVTRLISPVPLGGPGDVKRPSPEVGFIEYKRLRVWAPYKP